MKSSLTVSDLNKIIKSTLESNPHFDRVTVHGELSNVTKASSGHWYFTLKDTTSRIACVMFASAVRLLNHPFKEGEQVEVVARVTLYEAGGTLQITVSHMQLFGVGSLYAQLEVLRLKLQKEGLFDSAKKKPLPRFPLSIGVVTSLGSAAQADVHKTINSRWPIAKIQYYGSLVQGEASVIELIRALTTADTHNHDVIILVRGGGSIEDLWSFNHESLIRCIYNLKTPIVSGIGHESDTTLVDYVVDGRGSTPTGAAILATPLRDEVLQLIDNLSLRLQHMMNAKIIQAKTQANHATLSLARLSPQKLCERRKFLLTELSYRLKKSIARPHLHHILAQQQARLHHASTKIMFIKVHNLTQTQHLLATFDIMQPLRRGFAYIHVNERFATGIKDIAVDEKIAITMHDGTLSAQVLSKKENSNE